MYVLESSKLHRVKILRIHLVDGPPGGASPEHCGDSALFEIRKVGGVRVPSRAYGRIVDEVAISQKRLAFCPDVLLVAEVKIIREFIAE